jgi:Na+/H+ antiporter NhaD/arsenite permease-like protein
MIFGIPFEFFIFAFTLLGVALFHDHTLKVALIGLIAVLCYKLFGVGFARGHGFDGFIAHMAHEWVILANLLCLLVGFALLSNHFEKSEIPAVLPKYLPDDWKGGFVLLIAVFVLSAFLDNIAAALIGGAIAQTVFRGKVHTGYLVAIVAASNGGGSGSVVGDTTTTMMWLAGISPIAVLPAYFAAVPALVFFGIFASLQQHKLQPILKDATRGAKVDWLHVGIVLAILVSAVSVNVYVNTQLGEAGQQFPFLGAAVILATLLTAVIRKPDWSLVPGAMKGALFLLSLVLIASLMPVDHLPKPSWQSAFGLGFVSAVFDNIPLTALAINQGGYDWGLLAYAVGFGGSMIWFGSSAGVALASMFPQARSVGSWLRSGWHVAVAYVLGFMIALALVGWNPSQKRAAAFDEPSTPERVQISHYSYNGDITWQT